MIAGTKYYAEKLSAERLQQVYQIAPPRVKQYLEAEIQHVLEYVRTANTVLELGCGYGRILERFPEHLRLRVGMDNSDANLILGRQALATKSGAFLLKMEAPRLGFAENSFDLTLCLQNGISAFKVDPVDLIREMVRVTKTGGWIVLSSYAEAFWSERLEWFKLQSEAGLLGEIDGDQTRMGTIVCKDGFRATTALPEDFQRWCSALQLKPTLVEIDQSSLFCEICK